MPPGPSRSPHALPWSLRSIASLHDRLRERVRTERTRSWERRGAPPGYQPRELDREDAARSGQIADVDRAAALANAVAHDREPEPEPEPAPVGAPLLEGLEQVL